MNPQPLERRVTTTTTPTGLPGGNVIGTYLDPALFIPPLYAALKVREAGARVITGLTSNVDVPRQSQSVTAYWVAENTAITFSDPGFDRVSLRPKHLGTISEFSRNMLLQSTPDIETILRNDMSNVLARGLDAAAINGTGTNNDPVGILNTTGIGSVSLGTNGGTPVWANILALIEQVEVANVGDDARAFLGGARFKAFAMGAPKIPASNPALGFIMDGPDTLAGYRFLATNLVPSNGSKGTGTNLSALIYGNWSDLLIGMWSEVDILVNPYAETAYVKGKRPGARDADLRRGSAPPPELRRYHRHRRAVTPARFPDGLELRAVAELRTDGRRLEGYAATFSTPARIGNAFTETRRLLGALGRV